MAAWLPDAPIALRLLGARDGFVRDEACGVAGRLAEAFGVRRSAIFMTSSIVSANES